VRPSTLRRRASYAVLSAGLLAAGLVPLAASAAVAACPTYVDPEGDSAPVEPAVTGAALQDDGLDLLAITHSTAGGVFSSTVKTVKLLETGSDNSFGDWFQVNFTVMEKAVTIRVVRDANLTETTTTRMQVDGVTVQPAPEAVYDFKAATVTLKVKQADLEKAVGSALTGKPLTAMRALSYGNYGGPGLLFDDADAPEGAKHVFGTACKGGAKGKPAAAPAPSSPKPSGSAKPTPSASPSASSSPTPSGSASPSTSSSATASSSPSTSPTAAPEPTVPVPAPGCIGFADAKGDARPAGQAPNERHLDLLAVTGRTTDTTLSGHLLVDKLAARPSFPAFTGHRFEYEFTVGGKVVHLRATAEGPGEGRIDGVANPDLKVTAAFDVVSSQVVLTIERASLAKALGTPLRDGTVLEALTARSAARTPQTGHPADVATSEDAARARYTVGDGTCFAPKLSVSFPGLVQTSDGARVNVSMTTSDGRTAAGQKVTARVGNGRSVSATTDKQGNVTLVAPVTDAAGTPLLVVRSTGSAGKGELTSPLRVVAERAVLSLRSSGTGSTRTVTATLTDDDRPGRALPGQRVVLSFGGRSVAVTTDSAGRAVTQVPAGSAVEAVFAGRSGFLTEAKARAQA
jgi:hypothetical protein